ncbi:hypothetical protein BN938_1902 [Mucinivorans hirudinis]|uniref:Outer membrane protein beta-barrel domain-containing protein n=1 Tax=Mucinivorans hirudinis TaxID=1433126 RepID=A0A060R8U4_9BACT|nr:hypothetical protein BN938_1902 [Mucinivorans hirudinis]
MKKLLALTLLLVITLATASAQNRSDMTIKQTRVGTSMPVSFFFGPRLGANFATISSPERPNVKPIIGFTGGGFAEMQLAPWFALSLDILYSASGYDSEILDYIIAPVLLNFYVWDELALKVGVQPALLMRAQAMPTGGLRYATTGNYKRFELSVPVGISYVVWRNFQVDLRYQIGLSEISNIKNFSAKNNVLSLSVGIKF